MFLKIYRKAALSIVKNLGEEAMPEDTSLQVDSRVLMDKEFTSQTPGSTDQCKVGEGGSQGETNVTTEIRQPLKVPETVHVRITPENLKDYLGPPTYHKDRLYTTPPPPGVSTGLGYLGNGSGAVMPIEAVVSAHQHFSKSEY
jgi:ATP-dependent Lon protease